MFHLLCPPTWGILFSVGSRIFLPMIVQQLVVILLFSQKMSTCPSIPPSCFCPSFGLWIFLKPTVPSRRDCHTTGLPLRPPSAPVCPFLGCRMKKGLALSVICSTLASSTSSGLTHMFPGAAMEVQTGWQVGSSTHPRILTSTRETAHLPACEVW